MRLISKRWLWLLTAMVGMGCFLLVSARNANENRQQTISVDLSSQSSKIRNIFSDVNCWDFHGPWTSQAAKRPGNYFSVHYPFIKKIQFMTATGGSAERDLFLNPGDRSDVTDYKFTDILSALHQVVRQGLKPMIITGNVPEKLSQDPVKGAFGVNVRPPADYNAYYNYIRKLAEAVVREFGIDEVKTWSWGVLTEYENRDWFITADNSSRSTKIAYFKLYDYTVAALQDVIGAGNLFVGAHSMTVSKGLWDEQEFIDHVAKGINYKTGKRGTQINFLTSSFYDLSPGIPIPGNLTLEEAIRLLRGRAEADGLKGLKYGIDEGRLIGGPPDDNRPLTSRIVALSYQGAADARMFRIMADLQADWFSTWSLSTTGLWGGVRLVSTHVASLGYRMAGDRRVNLTVNGAPADTTDEVNGLAGFNDSTGTVHLMLYNYNDSIAARSDETPVITIHHIAPRSGGSVTIKQWTIDDTHGNFWPSWSADMHARGLTNAAFNWSKYSTELPGNLLHQADKEYWLSREKAYRSLAALDSTNRSVVISDHMLTLRPHLAHHGIVFFEISNVKRNK